MLGEQILVDSRLVVEAFGVAGRHQLDQIVITGQIFGEQNQVIGCLAGRAALGPPISRRDIHLAAEDRIQSAFARLVVKDHRREHVPVLGDRHRRHVQLHRPVEQFLDPARAVEQRILGVQVKVDEVGHIDG
jgi:hypothetical protein